MTLIYYTRYIANVIETLFYTNLTRNTTMFDVLVSVVLV